MHPPCLHHWDGHQRSITFDTPCSQFEQLVSLMPQSHWRSRPQRTTYDHWSAGGCHISDEQLSLFVRPPPCSYDQILAREVFRFALKTSSRPPRSCVMGEEMPAARGADLLLGSGRQWPAVVGDGLTSCEIRANPGNWSPKSCRIRYRGKKFVSHQKQYFALADHSPTNSASPRRPLVRSVVHQHLHGV